MGQDDVKRMFQVIQDATVAAFAQKPETLSATPARHSKQLQIEQAIVAFRPDALEASQLISAIAAGLKLRYSDCTEVLLRMTLLQSDLERLDAGGQTDAADILAAYEQQTGRVRA